MAERTLAEQIANKCVHFNGRQHDACRVGVVYKTVDDPDPAHKGFAGMPCFKDGVSLQTCSQRHFPTPEEVAAKVAEKEASFARTMTAFAAVDADAKAKGLKKGHGGYGAIPCPICKTGELRYSVASYNGHVHAGCTTPQCVSWMQ